MHEAYQNQFRNKGRRPYFILWSPGVFFSPVLEPNFFVYAPIFKILRFGWNCLGNRKNIKIILDKGQDFNSYIKNNIRSLGKSISK